MKQNKWLRFIRLSTQGSWLVLALVTAVSSFVAFRHFIAESKDTYAGAIASAFVGSLITIAVTGALLRYQAESETRKEKDVEVYQTKIEVYKELVKQMEDMILLAVWDERAVVRLQLMIHKVAFVADAKVVSQLQLFIGKMVEALEDDGKIESLSELQPILAAFAQVSCAIRHELRGPDDQNVIGMISDMDRKFGTILGKINSFNA